MNVIHLISGGDTGGAKTHVLSLLQHLNESITAQLVCFRDGEFAQEARDMGIPTEIFDGRNVVSTYRRLRRYIIEGGYEVIHCHGARANMMGALLRRGTALPVVTTVHSDYRLDYMGRPLGKLTYGTVNTLALRCFDYHIGVSDAMVDLLISRGFPPQQLYAIYNGLTFDAQPTLPDRTAYLRSLGAEVEENSVVVGIAARLNPVKDIATLIRAFALAAEGCPRLRLVIAGDGAEKDKLTALSKELNVAEKVCFAGWISDMDSFYQAIDINTLTSLSETFPYALTEGARYALPTVSSRVGGVPYLIDHAVNGLMFQPKDPGALAKCLTELAEDEALRRQMGERLREKAAERFSLQKTVDTQLGIYEDILRRHARPKSKRDGVVICGAYGKENAGDDAILSAIIQEMKGIDPYMPITVLSRQPKRTRLTYRVEAVHTFALLKWKRAMKHCRLYLNGGGSLIQDVTSRRSLWYYLYNIRAAKRRKNKVMMYGCGIGPVIRPRHQRLAAEYMNRYVDAITLREPDSLQELRRMGVDQPETCLSADPALRLPALDDALTDSTFLSHGVPVEGRYICFALRNWPGVEEKFEAIRAGAVHAYKRHGLTPLFLAVEKLHDPEVITRAAKGLPVPCHLITQPESPMAIIGVLSRMRAVVSMRLHALIFAAGKGVPLVGLVYDPKVSAFLRYIGEEQFMDLEDLTAKKLCAMIDAAVRLRREPDAVERLLKIEERNMAVAERLYRE
ncbi:MAG: polysaccharide pyruvyl transferase CsaB [Oscillospiraceae bacterium]|jgi:polysaccharide pyruvyl transferase CsaB|nr:polysaccharide pyruvyl transferase CsaB [Oscillospiraceae bacterium]